MNALVVIYIFFFIIINYFYELLERILLQNLSMCFMKMQGKSAGWWSDCMFCFNTRIFSIFQFSRLCLSLRGFV